MNLRELGHGLDLDHQVAADEQIEAGTPDSLALVVDRDVDLLGEGYRSEAQFTCESLLVNAFEEAGAEMTVNLNRGSNDLVGKPVSLGRRLAEIPP